MKQFAFFVDLSVMALFLFCAAEKRSYAVPAIPNGSMIVGTVVEYAIVSSKIIRIQPDQVLHKLTIHVESSEAIGNLPDFVKDKMGQNIPFYSREDLPRSSLERE